jgi:hypothetical protein
LSVTQEPQARLKGTSRTTPDAHYGIDRTGVTEGNDPNDQR